MNTAVSAPEMVPMSKPSMVPTRKWFAGVITALAAVLVNWITNTEFTKEIAVQLVGVVTTALVAYMVPNESKAP